MSPPSTGDPLRGAEAPEDGGTPTPLAGSSCPLDAARCRSGSHPARPQQPTERVFSLQKSFSSPLYPGASGTPGSCRSSRRLKARASRRGPGERARRVGKPLAACSDRLATSVLRCSGVGVARRPARAPQRPRRIRRGVGRAPFPVPGQPGPRASLAREHSPPRWRRGRGSPDGCALCALAAIRHPIWAQI